MEVFSPVGIKVAAVGNAIPGYGSNMPGYVFTNEKLVGRLKPISSRLSSILPDKWDVYGQVLKKFASITGIEQRSLMLDLEREAVDQTLRTIALVNKLREEPYSSGSPKIDFSHYPTEWLGLLAAIDTLHQVKENKEKEDKSFSVADVEGFIFITSVPDTQIPPSGSLITKVLGIEPAHFSNRQLACTSFISALNEACSLMSQPEADINNFLIVASEPSSRLKQLYVKEEPSDDRVSSSKSKKGEKKSKESWRKRKFKQLIDELTQNTLFGDAAFAIYLEKVKGPGGFIITTTPQYPNRPCPEIRATYPGDSKDLKRVADMAGKGSTTKYREFAQLETKEIKELLMIYKQLIGGFTENDRLVLPQLGKDVVKRSLSGIKDEEQKKAVEKASIENPVRFLANTGAAATLGAWWYGIKNGDIKPENRVGLITFGLGGIEGMGISDPNAEVGYRVVNLRRLLNKSQEVPLGVLMSRSRVTKLNLSSEDDTVVDAGNNDDSHQPVFADNKV